MFSEIKRYSERVDNYLVNPFDSFSFTQLEQIYNEGRAEFMKKHHKNLFLLVDFLYSNIRPKIQKLQNQGSESRQMLFVFWSNHLRKSLPSEAKDISESIADHVLTTISPHNVWSLLLNEKDEEIRNRIEAFYVERTAHIYRRKAKRPFVIEGERQEISFDEISQTLIEKAKPHIASLRKMFKELKMQNDKEVKAKLLPLLQEYISNPI